MAIIGKIAVSQIDATRTPKRQSVSLSLWGFYYIAIIGDTLLLAHVTNGSAAVMAQGQSNLGVQAYEKANLKAKWGN
ncbi:hypothetical protein [Nostoc sp.]|uniref:hypothetical protein n=1 Tax=Nostoc sp. TaxID=1180 RepID=UPI002FF92D29